MTTLHVLMCANDGYAMPLTIAAHSLLKHARYDAAVRLHVVTDGMSAANRTRVDACLKPAHPDVEVIWHDADTAQFDRINFRHYSVVALFRLLLPDLIPVSVERVLYLDCDIIVERDVSELWGMDLGDKAVWAVQNGDDDNLQELILSKFPDITAPDDARYFNSGVLLVNMAEWRRQNISDRTRSFLQDHSDILSFPDQDALNAVLVGNWGVLHPRWNKQIPRMGRPEAADPKDAGILHYTTTKPWNPRFTGRAKWAYHSAYLRSGWRDATPPWMVTSRLYARQLWHHNRHRLRRYLRLS